jgi:hypothetical protein
MTTDKPKSGLLQILQNLAAARQPPQTETPERKAEFSAEGNRATASVVSERILTPEQLLALLEIDLDEWTVERSVVNKWEGYRSAKTSDLTYDEGKVSGFVRDSGELLIEPLYQVKVWLVRKRPVALTPVISPVIVTVSERQSPLPVASGRQRALAISDAHFGFRRDFRTGELVPFHDRAVLGAALQLLATVPFDRFILMGDTLDLADFSDKFLRSPEMFWNTQPAIVEAAWFLGRVCQFVPQVDVIEGNHDDRLTRALIGSFMQAYDLRPADRLSEAPPMSIPGLLGLERMGIRYHGAYPAGEVYLNPRLRLVHGDVARNQPGATARAVLDNAQCSTGYGHIHRLENLTKTVRRGGQTEYVHSFCPGCACHIDGRVPGSKRDNDWQQGFAVIDYDTDGAHHISLVPVENGRAYFEKAEYTDDYLDNLRTDVDWGKWERVNPYNG